MVASILTRYREESIWTRRGAAAFALAPLAPVFIANIFSDENFLGAMMFGAVIAYGHMLVLGLPLAAWVNWRRKVSLLTSALGAAFIGLLPWAVFMGHSMLASPGAMGANALVAMIFSFCFFGGMGFIAGVAWWFISKPRRPTPISATVP
ncbi:MAG TPA: hypothetical protein VGM47_00965 [Gammaproteobacteria bacterium]|jgi:hypothetical protein